MTTARDAYPIIQRLNRRYSLGKENSILDCFRGVYEKHIKHRREQLVDLIVSAGNLGFLIHQDQPNALVLKAIQLTNPNFEPESLATCSHDVFEGMRNSAKGKYFELLVADKLNKGETVGDLVLPDGYRAELAESLGQ